MPPGCRGRRRFEDSGLSSQPLPSRLAPASAPAESCRRPCRAEPSIDGCVILALSTHLHAFGLDPLHGSSQTSTLVNLSSGSREVPPIPTPRIDHRSPAGFESTALQDPYWALVA